MPELDKYGQSPEQRLIEVLNNLYECWEEDIEEENGIIERLPNGIRFQYPTGRVYQIEVTQYDDGIVLPFDN